MSYATSKIDENVAICFSLSNTLVLRYYSVSKKFSQMCSNKHAP